MRKMNLPHKLLGRIGLVLLAFTAITTSLYASHKVGDAVVNPQGERIGSIAAPFENSANLSPSVIIQLLNGDLEVVATSTLLTQGNAVVLPNALPAKNTTDAAIESAFEIRSMSMVLVMQSHEDSGILGDVSELDYDIHGNTLYLRGSLNSIDDLVRVLAVTAELCDYEIAPLITIRRSVVPG